MADYLSQFRGNFKSTMHWSQLDELWQTVRKNPGGWYVYAIGEPVPVQPLDQPQLLRFIQEIDTLLRTGHAETYCGIVYADDLQAPQMVKIYDPDNLGVSCGYSDNPPLPGWVLSRTAPVDLPATQVVAKNRRRWWRRLFSG